MFMVILGGVATTMGPLLGAITFIVVEEVLYHNGLLAPTSG